MKQPEGVIAKNSPIGWVAHSLRELFERLRGASDENPVALPIAAGAAATDSRDTVAVSLTDVIEPQGEMTHYLFSVRMSVDNAALEASFAEYRAQQKEAEDAH